jgi:hypothetical protein
VEQKGSSSEKKLKLFPMAAYVQLVAAVGTNILVTVTVSESLLFPLKTCKARIRAEPCASLRKGGLAVNTLLLR